MCMQYIFHMKFSTLSYHRNLLYELTIALTFENSIFRIISYFILFHISYYFIFHIPYINICVSGKSITHKGDRKSISGTTRSRLPPNVAVLEPIRKHLVSLQTTTFHAAEHILKSMCGTRHIPAQAKEEIIIKILAPPHPPGAHDIVGIR